MKHSAKAILFISVIALSCQSGSEKSQTENEEMMIVFHTMIEIESGVKLNISSEKDFHDLCFQVFPKFDIAIESIKKDSTKFVAVIYKKNEEPFISRLFTGIRYYQYQAIFSVDWNTSEFKYKSEWVKGTKHGPAQLDKKEWPVEEIPETKLIQLIEQWKP